MDKNVHQTYEFHECHILRREALFAGTEHVLADARVLEIAPAEGLLTESIFSKGAQSVVAVERNPEALGKLRSRFESESKSGKFKVIDADVHHELYKFTPGQFDVIICTGFLYHTPHPFWILEGIANLHPRHVLIETVIGAGPGLAQEERINEPGQRQSDKVCVSFNFVLTPRIIIEAMTSLGYQLEREVAKESYKDFGSDPRWTENETEYLNKWIDQQFSAWFRRSD